MSIQRLGTEVIDLYQVHMQDTSVRIDETLRALDDLVREGKVRYVGCSNYTGYRLVESLWTAEKQGVARYEAVQLQWSLMVRDAEREVVPAAKSNQIGILVWSPLAGGFLSGKYQRGMQQPAGTRLGEWKDTWKRVDKDHNWNILAVVERIAKKHETTAAAVSLAWLLFAHRGLVGHRRCAQ